MRNIIFLIILLLNSKLEKAKAVMTTKENTITSIQKTVIKLFFNAAKNRFTSLDFERETISIRSGTRRVYRNPGMCT